MSDSIEPAPVDALRAPGHPTRREWWTLLVLVTIAFALRAACPSRMAIEHFDEGVYASNLYADEQDPPHTYPDRHLYAPPLFPAVLEWTLVFGGRRPHAVMWVNILAGAVTVFVVWWGMRNWFGPGAGIAAAALAATSDCHIAFSRMALTDVPLCLWMAAGVFTAWRAVLTGRPVWIAFAAVCAALAWWTKYNGWLTLAITGSGTAAWLLFDRPRTISAASALGRWAAVAALAVLLWLPFLWTIPAGNSYAEISANHAKYLVGLAGWWNGLLHHVDTLRYLDGWTSVTGIAAAVLLAGWASCERFTWNGNSAASAPRWTLTSVIAAAAIGGGALACGSTVMLALLAAAGLTSLGAAGLLHRCDPRRAAPVRKRASVAADPLSHGRGSTVDVQVEPASLPAREPGTPTSDLPPSHDGTRLAFWMLAAWFLGLLAATPLYHPYPRLVLPWLMACWLATGAVLGPLLERANRCFLSRPPTTRGNAIAAATALLLLLAAVPLAVWRGPPIVPPHWTPWQDHTDLQRIASAILRDAARTVDELGPSGHPQMDAVFYVYAEPGLFFHLEAAQDGTRLRYVSSPATSLALRDPVEVSVFLVTGPHAHGAGAAGDPAVQQYRPIATYAYHPSDLVQLDEYPAARLLDDAGPPAEEVRLYLVHGPQSAP